MAVATALFGPWLDPSMRLAVVIHHSRWQPATACCLAPRLQCLHHQERGIVFNIQYPHWAQPNIMNSFASLVAPGLWRGPRLPPFFLLCACI